MEFLPASQLIRSAAEDGYAVPAFSVWNAETANTVLRVASDCRAPVILMNGVCELVVMPPALMAAVIRAVAGAYDIPAALHLDHGDSMAVVDSCIAAGYTSVMLDYSTKPFAENAAALRRVVEKAHPRGITVEGEIGAVGRADDATGEGRKASTLTDPGQVRAYVEQTGIDMVAVSIGNAHGNYPSLPKLDFELLAALREAAGIPLVLHGGSGTPDEDIRKAISLGIRKVNIASELVNIVRQTHLDQWNAGQRFWVAMSVADAMEAMAKVVERWIHRTGAAGRA